MILGLSLISLLLLLVAMYNMNRAQHIGNAWVGVISGLAGFAVAILAFIKLAQWAGL